MGTDTEITHAIHPVNWQQGPRDKKHSPEGGLRDSGVARHWIVWHKKLVVTLGLKPGKDPEPVPKMGDRSG